MAKTPDASRRSEASRRAILLAAEELVSEVGYAKLTIEAIAARAGVGKQTIYRWWPSKGTVVLDAFLSRQQETVGAAMPDTGDFEADLRLVLRMTVDGLIDPRYDTPYRAMLAEAQVDPAFAAELVNRLLGPLWKVNEVRLTSAREAGQIAADVDLYVATELIYGPFYHRWLLRTGPLTHDFADTITDLVLRALRP